jgi:aspartyl-tRNA(Asn)/glutamyl-tRNA(Gln) amidotransferase subunit C
MDKTLKEWFTTAALAQLELDDREAVQLAAEAERMRELFLIMSEADTENLEPTTHAMVSGNRTREDRASVFNNADDLIGAAPESEDEFFLIPNVL